MTTFQRYTKAIIEPLNETREKSKGLFKGWETQYLYHITLTRPGFNNYTETWWCPSDDEAEKVAVNVLAEQNAKITAMEDRHNRIRVVNA